MRLAVALWFALATAVSGMPVSVVNGKPPLPTCQIFHENQCSGDVIITPPEFENHRWYTPARSEPGWVPSFQDYSHLVAFARLTYAADRMSCDVEIFATHRTNGTALTYVFDGVSQSSNTKTYTTAQMLPVQVMVADPNNRQIALEPIDFHWTAPAVNHSSGDYRNGQKGAIVEMFGWPHADVEQECAEAAKAGYLGLKVFPIQEQVMSGEPFNNVLNPWYFMYQPVSYRLSGRMGTRDDLRKLIHTCRSLGVRVYADAVVNHMTGGGNDANPSHRNPDAGCSEWGAKNSSLPGGTSPMYTQNFVYTYGQDTDQPPSQEFPAAAYGPQDFHCERALNAWTDPLDLNAGWLTGLTDLNTERDYVRERIAAYMTDLLSIGFSGFRIDAAKHIHPNDLAAIFAKLQRNMGGALPEDFISWLEVLLGGEADLLMCDPASVYNYGIGLEKALIAAGLVQTDVDKIKVWNSGYPKESDKGTCGISKHRSAVQNDDADQQNPGSTSRDMGDQGCVLVRGCDVNEHRAFEVKLFDSPNGADDNDNDYPIRLILSSFYFPNDTAMGLPDGKSDCSQCTTMCETCHGMPYTQAFDAASTGYDKIYTRVHRDSSIISAMRKWMHLD